MTTTPPTDEDLRTAVRRLGLYGLLAHWDEVRHCEWLPRLLAYEQTERQRRSLVRRLGFARLGAFTPLADFDWQWPQKIDRAAIEELCALEFLTERANVVLIGPNGTGKTMIAKNLAHLALLHGHTARFTTASAMLNDLAAQDSAAALAAAPASLQPPRRARGRRAGLLVLQRPLPPICSSRSSPGAITNAPQSITTNKAFADWKEVFPNAASVVALIDRLVHRAEILTIEGDSYRLKEATERAAQKAKTRKARRGHDAP